MQSKRLPRSTPAKQGVAAEGIMKFLDAIEKDAAEKAAQELHSFMLLRHGQVVAEGWWSPYKEEMSHMLFSLSKSFTSTAIGFAVQEGILSVEESVMDYFQEDLPEVVSDKLKAMKIKHLLSMSTGHGKDTMEAVTTQPDGNWAKGFLGQQLDYDPGTYFLYNTGATYMLSAILQKKTGTKLVDYLKPRLFEPLGIENPVWEESPKGINTGGFGLNIKTEDIAKFGQLYLQKGTWEGKRIINSEWIEEATKKQISNDNEENRAGDWGQGYCYQFWRCRNNAYRGDGAFGQYCIVIPEQDAVIAITSGVMDMQLPLNYIFEYLLPAFSDHELIGNEAQDEKLMKRLSELSITDKNQSKSDLEFSYNSKTFLLNNNPLELKEITLVRHQDSYSLNLGGEYGELKISCGENHWIENAIAGSPILKKMPGKPGHPSRIIAKADLIENNKVHITMRLIETPFYVFMKLTYSEQEIIVETGINLGFEKPEPIIIGGKVKAI